MSMFGDAARNQMDSREASRYLGISRRTLYRLVKTRQISTNRSYDDSGDRRLFFDKKSLDWFKGQQEMSQRAKNFTESQKQRAKEFDDGWDLYQRTGETSSVICCIHHPDRPANRSGYVFARRRTCGSCKTNRRADGSPRPAHARNVRKRDYAKSMELRKFYFGRSRMTAMRVFERCTGLNLEDFGFSRKEINAKHN
jgi:excisionase family DNA binding protein